jgi:hypothetical protein
MNLVCTLLALLTATTAQEGAFSRARHFNSDFDFDLFARSADCFLTDLPEHGQTSAKSAAFGDSVELSCEAGYLGSQTITCLADGAWSPITYSCTLVVCDLTSLPENCVASAKSGNYGDTNKLSRFPGFTGSETVVCLADGSWSPITYSCTPVACEDALVLPEHGYSKMKTALFGEIVDAGCEEGYSGSQQIQCLSDGSWAPVTYTCNVVVCLTTPVLPDFGSTGAAFGAEGEVVAVGCMQGFVAEKSDLVATCLPDGSWSVPTYTCKSVECTQDPTLPAHGVIMARNTVSNTMHLGCDVGFWGSQANCVLYR